jgi:hypothetical protein
VHESAGKETEGNIIEQYCFLTAFGDFSDT